MAKLKGVIGLRRLTGAIANTRPNSRIFYALGKITHRNERKKLKHLR